MRKAVKRKKQKPGPGKRAERRTEYLREFYVFLKLLFFFRHYMAGNQEIQHSDVHILRLARYVDFDVSGSARSEKI
jgi:hypothetical protein